MASMIDVGIALKRLRLVLPPPRGIKLVKDEFTGETVISDEALAIYIDALVKYPAEEIDEGIRRFLGGECDEKISLKFYPRPPELARIVAGVHAENAKAAHEQARRDQLAADRREMAESAALAIKTPEQKARVAEIMARYRAGLPVHDPVNRPADRDPWFVERTRDPFPAREPLRDHVGMTDEQFAEAVAAIPDRDPLPAGMVQVGDAAPAVPAPAAPALDPVEALAFEDIGEFLKANT